ncbi:hypothetical protein [Vibrio navarrensis]|uniref:hypothetical protein n=1 Tax=Vibrio navarrensis TaxID=29495 RepID=UPI00186A9DFF|nr:hypothetical protein [Vibrio navarrensis]MBE4617394.1 hypothetical protein [Vibrio navarrensis]
MLNKRAALIFIKEEADLAMLALTSPMLGDHEDGLLALQKKMQQIGEKARGLLALEEGKLE